MKPTRMRLLGLAAALSTLAIAIPVSSAAAATTAPIAIVSSGPDGSAAITLPARGQAGTVTGPTFITKGSASFTDTNIVVTSGGAFVTNHIVQ
jgi:hypothetical protein